MLENLMKGWTVGDFTFWIMALTVLDLFCTYIGMGLGLVSETNPLLSNGLAAHPLIASALTVFLVWCCLTLLNKVKHRKLFDILGGLFFVKVGVMIMHVGWMTAAFCV